MHTYPWISVRFACFDCQFTKYCITYPNQFWGSDFCAVEYVMDGSPMPKIDNGIPRHPLEFYKLMLEKRWIKARILHLAVPSSVVVLCSYFCRNPDFKLNIRETLFHPTAPSMQ
jgi:hypothetical protein